MPRPKPKNEENVHGISCNCPRCVGLRRYPQPSMCDWCGSVHAGDSNNCPENSLDTGNGSRHDVPEREAGNSSVSWEPDPQTEVICSLVSRDIKAITRMVRQESKMGLKDMLDSKGGGGTLLKGSDIPTKVKQVTIEVDAIRATEEGWNAPAIIDFKKEVYGAMAWAVNKTNMKQLIKLFGDDEKKLRGKKIKLDVFTTRNPSSGEMVPSLAISPRQ